MCSPPEVMLLVERAIVALCDYANAQSHGEPNSTRNQVVTPADYVDLLSIYARSHRKDGRPYLAEALHPDTGSFEGHDGYNHSSITSILLIVISSLQDWSA